MGEKSGEKKGEKNGARDGKPVAVWLLICCATIFCMVVLGGVTRLTGSGLSMVEWEPIMGTLPPLSEVEWRSSFELYKQYPEYKLKNAGMDLDGFKSIFWFEYSHRVLGRLIGVMFAVPMIVFMMLGAISRPLVPRLVVLFVLGGMQGLMGWYMVRSGMVDDPHVSQYRLTAHLLLALLIYGYMFWVALDVLGGRAHTSGSRLSLPAPPESIRKLNRRAYALLGFVVVTIASGGFVAGLKAGFTYNTFPLMNGQWIPDGILLLQPAWRNLFENITTVQFDHRLLAITLALAVVGFYLLAIRVVADPRARLALHLLLGCLLLQISLGILTLLLVVPVSLAAAHQGGAVLLLTASLLVAHRLRNYR